MNTIPVCFNCQHSIMKVLPPEEKGSDKYRATLRCKKFNKYVEPGQKGCDDFEIAND